MKELLASELRLDPEHYSAVNKWLARGDGIAVYESADMSSASLGHRKYVSYGSSSAQIETNEPPQRLPDIGSEINWRYRLVGVYRGEQLVEDLHT